MRGTCGDASGEKTKLPRVTIAGHHLKQQWSSKKEKKTTGSLTGRRKGGVPRGVNRDREFLFQNP